MVVGLLAAAAIVASTPQGGVLPGEQDEYNKVLAAKARLADQTFRGWCANTDVQVVSVASLKFSDRPEVIGWRVNARVTGCGHSSTENINVGRTGGASPWLMTFGLPGRSLAGMELQLSTFPAASVEARKDFRDCQDQMLSDVYVTARQGGIDIFPPGSPFLYRKGRPAALLPADDQPLVDKLDLGAAWEEIWPFDVCGHDRTLGVVFIPYKDQAMSHYLFLPLWQMVEKHGPGSLHDIAPPVE